MKPSFLARTQGRWHELVFAHHKNPAEGVQPFESLSDPAGRGRDGGILLLSTPTGRGTTGGLIPSLSCGSVLTFPEEQPVKETSKTACNISSFFIVYGSFSLRKLHKIVIMVLLLTYVTQSSDEVLEIKP